MKLFCRVKMSAIFWLKTGAKIVIDEDVEQSYDEYSDEYEDLCNQYQSKIGFDRADDPKMYDKEMLRYIRDIAEKQAKNKIDSVTEVFKVSRQKGVTGHVSFGSCLLDVSDISAMKIDDFKINLSKE